MRKLGVYHFLTLALTFVILLSLVWLIILYNRPEPDPLLLKAKQYYKEVVIENSKNERLKLLSAFDFDDGYITVLTAKFYKTGTPVYCHYFDNNRRVIPDASRQISLFTDTTARCPKHKDSSFIALSYSFQKSTHLISIPIKRRQFYENKHDLVVCVELELQPNWLEITSFIEYHRNLNFEYFHFTTIDVNAYTRRILDDYIRLGIARLTSLRRSENTTNSKVFDEFKSIQRTNCLLNARLDSKLVTFLRNDERVADIPFFLQNFNSDEISETRIVTKTIERGIALEKFTNETKFESAINGLKYKKNVQFRKVIDPKQIERLDQISEDFVYKKASTYFPTIRDSVTSSIVSRLKYNYDTRPIYCDEFDIEVLSWCPVNVYHCRFRDEESKKSIMEKREEARKVRYKQETIRW